MDNNGPTLTHALASNSPALDSGDNFACANFNVVDDQRGRLRNDGLCDKGAFEGDQTACYVVKASNGNIVTFCL